MHVDVTFPLKKINENWHRNASNNCYNFLLNNKRKETCDCSNIYY